MLLMSGSNLDRHVLFDRLVDGADAMRVPFQRT